MKHGLDATYANLLELFVDAGHTQCAEAVCEVLRKKCEIRVLVNSMHPIVFPIL